MADLNSFSNIKTNFNVSPYFDDWVKEKGFQRVLFKPSVAVQARELTQAQTIISDQLAQLADFNLKEGSIIKGGEITINTSFISGNAKRIEIPLSSPLYEKIKFYTDNPAIGETPFIGNKLIYEEKDANAITIKKIVFRIVGFVDPVSSLDNFAIIGVYETSAENEFTTADSYQVQSQHVVDEYNFYFEENTNNIDSIFPSISSENVVFSSVGTTSYATIDEGIFYAKGYFIYFPAQTVVLDKTTNKPNCKIGIQLYEEIVDSAEDATLFDNAIGSPNENAPGADRFKITAKFESKTIDLSVNEDNVDYVYGALENNSYNDFFEITRILDGNVINTISEDILGDIKDIMAQKINDINGDFEVTPFKVEVKEDLKPETRQPEEKYYSLVIGRGEAYVQGYEIAKKSETLLDLSASRDVSEGNIYNIGDSYLSYIRVKINPSYDPQNISEFLSVINDSYILRLYAGDKQTVVADLRIRDIVYGGADYFDLFVYNIELKGASPLSDARHIYHSDGSKLYFDIQLLNGEVLQNPNYGKIIYPLKEKRINSVSSIEYTARQFTASSVQEGTISMTLASTEDSFVEQTVQGSELAKYESDFIVFAEVSNEVQRLEYNKLEFTPTSLKITPTGSYDNNTSVIISFKNKRSLTSFSSKTLTTTTQTATTTDSETIPAYQKIELAEQDVYAIENVEYSVDGADPITINDFVFNSGQTDDCYKNGDIYFFQEIPAKTVVTITYKYFEHNGTGPFVAQSYDSSLRYMVFHTDSSGNRLDLTDCLDFRRKENTNITPLANNNAVEIKAFYSSYLARYDKLFLNKDGNFQILRGNSSKDPKLPQDPSNGITLYSFLIDPYTLTRDEISSRKYDYKRYTMKDISTLERRIESLESRYDFSSSEQKVRDDNSNVAVSGILVDNFVEPRTVDFSDNETNCTIDLETNALKPYYDVYNFRLKEKESSNYYTKAGDLITLKHGNTKRYIETGSVEGAKPANITPTNSGFVKLYPDIDVWKDPNKISYISNTADRVGKAYKDLSSSQTKNKEILSVTWPTTTKNIIKDSEQKEFDNDFGDIVYNESIIEYLTQQCIVFKSINLFPNASMSFSLSENDINVVFPAITAEVVLSSDDYKRLDVEDYSFPWVLQINIGGVDYRFKVIHKENGSVTKLYLLHEELFDMSVDSNTKISNRVEYYPNLDLLSSGIISISDGTNNLDISAYSKFTVPDSLDSFSTDSEGRFYGAFCVEENISNLEKDFTITIDNNKTRTKFYSLLDIQNKISRLNLTRRLKELTIDNVPLRQKFEIKREDNRFGLFIDSVDLFISKKPNDSTVSIVVSKVNNGEISYDHVYPGSVVHVQSGDISVLNYTNFKFEFPLYLEPGIYAVSIFSNSDKFSFRNGSVSEPLFLETDNNELNLDCRINFLEFSNTSEKHTLILQDPPEMAKDVSLVNMNGTFISGLNNAVGPRFFIGSEEIIPNKNIEPLSNITIDQNTEIGLTMSTEEAKISPVVDLQTLSLIAVKYHSNISYVSKPISMQKDFTSNSVNVGVQLYVPVETLSIKCYVKVDTIYSLSDPKNQWIEAPIDTFSFVSKSTNRSDFKDLLYTYVGTEIFNTFKIKVEITDYPHYDIAVIDQISAISFMS